MQMQIVKQMQKQIVKHLQILMQMQFLIQMQKQTLKQIVKQLQMLMQMQIVMDLKDQLHDVVDAIRPLAAEAGRSMAELAIGWVLANPTITSPIVGATRPEQLDDALAAEASPLDDDLKAALDEVSAHLRLVDADR